MTDSVNIQTATAAPSIGAEIRRLRKRKGMTQEELGRKIGVTGATINKYETGIVVNLRRPTIESLAKHLDTSPAQLMGWIPNTEDKSSVKAVTVSIPTEKGKHFGHAIIGARNKNTGAAHEFRVTGVKFAEQPRLRATSKEEDELLRIFKSLSVKNRMSLLKYAMELEDSEK